MIAALALLLLCSTVGGTGKGVGGAVCVLMRKRVYGLRDPLILLVLASLGQVAVLFCALLCFGESDRGGRQTPSALSGTDDQHWLADSSECVCAGGAK